MTGARIHPDFQASVERVLVAEVGGRLSDLYLPDDQTLNDLWAIGRTPDDNTPGSRYRDVARNIRIEGRRTVYVAADGTRTALTVPRDGLTPHHEPLAPRSHATVVWSQFPDPDTRVYVPASGVFDLGGMADMVVLSNRVVYRLTVDVGPRALKRFIPDVSQGFRASPSS